MPWVVVEDEETGDFEAWCPCGAKIRSKSPSDLQTARAVHDMYCAAGRKPGEKVPFLKKS